MAAEAGDDLFGTGVRRICAVVQPPRPGKGQQVRSALRETKTMNCGSIGCEATPKRAHFSVGCRRTIRKRQPLSLPAGGARRREFAGESWAGTVMVDASAPSRLPNGDDLEMETYRDLPEGFVREYPIPKRILLSMPRFRSERRNAGKIGVARHGLVTRKNRAKARTISDSAVVARGAAFEELRGRSMEKWACPGESCMREGSVLGTRRSLKRLRPAKSRSRR